MCEGAMNHLEEEIIIVPKSTIKLKHRLPALRSNDDLLESVRRRYAAPLLRSFGYVVRMRPKPNIPVPKSQLQ